MSSTMRWAVLFAAVGVSGATCDTFLAGLVSDVKSKMPGRDSELYFAPGDQAMADFEAEVLSMMQGSCGAALPASLSSYTRHVFHDCDTNADYCVLQSTADNDNNGVVDAPWGTVVVNQANNTKNLSIDIPHPRFDSRTGEQGIAVFKGTNARSFILSGSHRHANDAESSCQPNSYQTADAAHTINAFQSSIKAVLAYYDNLGIEYTAIQFHGMGSSTCPGVDAYLTHGSSIAPQQNEKVDLLRDQLSLLLPQSKVFTVPGDSPSCGLTGTSNVQGRLINGVPPESVCTRRADGYTGRFIHIEQKSSMRDASQHNTWISAINAVDFTKAVGPRGFTVLTPNGGEVIGWGTEYTITWDSTGITGDVKLSTNDNNDAKTFRDTIEETAPNTGSYTWVVGSNIDLGDNIVIRIRSVEDTKIRDYSDASISIVNPIVVPNPGDLTRGSMVEIQWSAPGITSKVKVSLHQGSSHKHRRNIAKVTTNDGSHMWRVPNSVTPGGSYHIRVRSVDDTGIKMYSTNFNVV